MGEITKASKEKLSDNICRGMGITDSTKCLSYEEVKRGIAWKKTKPKSRWGAQKSPKKEMHNLQKRLLGDYVS